jgi:hypothetical protein
MPILNTQNIPSSISQLMQMLMLKKMMGQGQGQGGFPSDMSNFARQNATQEAAGMAQAASPMMPMGSLATGVTGGQPDMEAIRKILAMLSNRP